MGIIHEFFYDNKWLGILMVLGGLTYSGFLYFRAYEQWIGAKRQDSGRRLRHHLRQRPGSGEGSKIIRPPSPGASTSEGQQEDLLARLAREEDEAAPEEATGRTLSTDTMGELPKETGTERSTRSDLKPDPAYRSTHILKPFDDFSDEDEGEGEGEDDDQGGGTATSEERTPLQNAIRAAVEESLREDEAGTGAEDDDRDPLITGEPSPLASPVQTPQRKRSSATHEEAQRRAQRIEEMGLHREVQADRLSDPAVRRISDDDRRRKLSQLGIAFDADTVETEAQRRARLGTDELDDILGRLDAALATPAPAKPAAPPAPVDAHAPTVIAGPQPPVDAQAPTVIADAPQSPVETQAPSADATAASPDSASAGPELPDSQTGMPETDEPAGGADADEAEDAVQDPDGDDSDDAIPDWARADTFDDDEPRSGDGAQQQKLF